MNVVPMEKFLELERRYAALEAELKAIRGTPNIKGYSGKTLELNDNLNVVELRKEIRDIKTRLDNHNI